MLGAFGAFSEFSLGKKCLKNALDFSKLLKTILGGEDITRNRASILSRMLQVIFVVGFLAC